MQSTELPKEENRTESCLLGFGGQPSPSQMSCLIKPKSHKKVELLKRYQKKVHFQQGDAGPPFWTIQQHRPPRDKPGGPSEEAGSGRRAEWHPSWKAAIEKPASCWGLWICICILLFAILSRKRYSLKDTVIFMVLAAISHPGYKPF